ncbi:AraC family transcriptional regulator [Herbaspirillum huttiense]|jgi:AraC-like DNA-binding protein|uniref:AraC family transcriptional regulator n=2 Tax=Oxalobacteraceae TaxID=75682 RepID=UPI000C0B79EC|nr:transcriptional regulator [Herbaspirillum sp.]MBN9358928.1 AraC family transcriptional regulator [Herbaspirillum huttiense]MCP3658030.1 AraC family transcriptional regulator [Herbaspirillum sp.]MCP3946560.1 AraC family transcriptional regulator [Herbaspirillum sp.]MCP4029768.1 AraC family transcriptional regulator [Herbaspirillum sp.]|tara:strand:+ start:3390 stop:4415 length:1026 start_codon:yes stop_codon:yes gene_type:complete
MMNVLHSDPSTGRMPMPASVERLLNGSNKLLFASSDLDEVRSMVGRVMKPHRLDLTGQGERLDARMHYTSLGDLSVSRLRYGSAVQIEPGSLDSFFLVQMPLYGMARIESGAQHIDSSAELASVLSPQEATRMTWMAGTDQLMLRLSRSLVERTLVGYLGHPLNEPLRFELGFRWRECAPWQCMLSYLIDCTLQHHDLAMHKIVVSQIEQLAASILVTSHRHNHCEDAPARRSTILPRHVRRAQDFLEAHAHEPVTAEQLAQAAGVSVRSLYAGFKDFLGVSPMQYLRDLRMERARAELMSGDSNHVAGVALRWGFAHMGRFSNEYKQRYGESPSKTLRAR